MGEKIMREARAQQAELDQENGGPLADHVLLPVQVLDMPTALCLFNAAFPHPPR
jgi:hypothetical protein